MMGGLAEAGTTTQSDEVGTPFGDQFDATFQLLLAEPFQVFELPTVPVPVKFDATAVHEASLREVKV